MGCEVGSSEETHPTAVGTATLTAGQVDVDGRHQDLKREGGGRGEVEGAIKKKKQVGER